MDPDAAAKPPWTISTAYGTQPERWSACGRPRGVLYRASPKIDPLLRARAHYRCRNRHPLQRDKRCEPSR